MNQIFDFDRLKKKRQKNLSSVRPFKYPESKKILLKTFKIKYQKSLSIKSKLILNSFQNKYIYYAIDDILYGLKLDTTEQEDLLAILYSPILFLHNNFLINFLNIWIKEIYINKVLKTNKFLIRTDSPSNQYVFITIKVFYQIPSPIKEKKSLW